ncbi:hypothetical protein [Christiangramia sp. SM2212]|uniref:Uncharacterized protein n=1 Tax=Christiangramia sediminicola TaxID=3073267 RepID=A0ABU1EL33_9FLAO|nr:hypothetical protein [Christiangramia sp. SM2212]MDR5589095.1 hypothetical protein [Christiangramia sp. SM2212]
MSKTGEINKDKILDSVAVTQDTISKIRPCRLQIFFGQNDKNMKLVLQTDNAILPDLPGGIDRGNRFSEVDIVKNNLWIKHELLRGHFEHRFQFREGKFKLMEYNFVESNGRGKVFYENLDFTTGIRRSQTDSYKKDKVLSKKEEYIVIETRPDLSNFNARSNKFY